MEHRRFPAILAGGLGSLRIWRGGVAASDAVCSAASLPPLEFLLSMERRKLAPAGESIPDSVLF